MSTGRLIAVVGPSGVGKDSVMAGLHGAMPRLHLVRRVITRAADPGGEDHIEATEPQFAAMVQDGAFALHWRAHGLAYGIPASVRAHLDIGTDCLVNLSRAVLAEAAQVFDRVIVLHITAAPETLARRLAARGREAPADVAARLAQATKPLPAGLDVIHLPNDGPLAETVARAVALLQQAGADR